MPGSLSPAFVLLNYHSQYGPHTQIIPTLNWSPVASTNPNGQFETHAGGDIDALDMIVDLVDLLEPFYPTDVEYDNFQIYTQATPTSAPVPRSGGALTNVGTSASPGYTKAVQTTATWRTSNFGIFKLVMLDSASGDNFGKITNPASDVSLDALDTYIKSDSHGWAGRDDGAPIFFIQLSQTLNEKLRRSYRET